MAACGVVTASELRHPSAGKWHSIGAESGFPSAAAGAVFIDHDGRLWVSIETRIYQLDRATGKFVDSGIDGSARNMAETTMKLSRHAEVLWQGGIKTGGRTVSTESGALRQHPYGYGSRFADQNGTNPEELIAAARAACFTMYLPFILDGAGLVAMQLDTRAALTLQLVPMVVSTSAPSC